MVGLAFTIINQIAGVVMPGFVIRYLSVFILVLGIYIVYKNTQTFVPLMLAALAAEMILAPIFINTNISLIVLYAFSYLQIIKEKKEEGHKVDSAFLKKLLNYNLVVLAVLILLIIYFITSITYIAGGSTAITDLVRLLVIIIAIALVYATLKSEKQWLLIITILLYVAEELTIALLHTGIMPGQILMDLVMILLTPEIILMVIGYRQLDDRQPPVTPPTKKRQSRASLNDIIRFGRNS